MIIEDWQVDLKKVTQRIVWDDPEAPADAPPEEKTRTYFHDSYIHRNRAGE
jgi:hypothetical protein